MINLLRLYSINLYSISLLLSTLLLAACGSPEPQPLVFNAAPWQAGEVSTYQITGRDGQAAGSARYEMIAGGEHVAPTDWTIRRTVETADGTEEVAVEVEAEGLRPLFSSFIRKTTQGELTLLANYNQGEINLESTSEQGIKSYETASVPSDVRDQRALLQLVRALPLAADYATKINAYLPVSNLYEPMDVQVVKSEQVTVPAGEFSTWLVRMETNSGRTEAWIAQEPPYVLVKATDSRSGGTFLLTSFQPRMTR